MDTTSLRWRARVAKEAVTQSVGNQNFGKDMNDEKRSADVSAGCCGTGMSWLDGVAAASVASSLLTVQRENIVTKTASIATLILGPYSAYQKRKLRAIGELIKQQNILRQYTNDFSLQNEVLHRKLKRLDANVSNLEAVEQELALFASDQNELQRLQYIVERQREVQMEMRKCLQKRILRDIVQVVVNADRERDFAVSPQELEVIVLRMKAIAGVEFNEGNFRELMASDDRSISCIMRMIRQLMHDDDDTNDIFSLHPQKLIGVDKKDIV